MAGHQVIIGSRSVQKAEQVAKELSARLADGAMVAASDNEHAAAAGEIVVLAVPYDSLGSILQSVKAYLHGKLLISVVAPLKSPKVSQAWRPDAGSAAQEAQALLGDSAPVFAAFQNISAEHIADPNCEIQSDVLVCGDSKSHLDIVEQLVRDARMRPVYAGPLVNASVVEGFTAVLIGINVRYKVKGAGIRITELSE